MRVMYLAYMFHTNQAPVIRGWVEDKDEVLFVCHTKGATENHKYGKPYILGYSKFFLFINTLYQRIMKRKIARSSFPEAFSGKYGFPSKKIFRELLCSWKPDIVIIRDRSLYSVRCYLQCKKNKVPTILYNQTPYNQPENKKDLLHRILYKLSPEIRMTPVLGSQLEEKEQIENTYYVPFVMYPEQSYKDKEYFKNGKINILCIGKYEERKNLYMLLKVVNELVPEYDIHLVFAGEVSTDYHKNFYNKITSFINENNLQSIVDCYTNIDTNEVGKLYRAADLFVLPSTKEFASVSQLEAMSYALPVIVSDTNGTACYVHEGLNGYLFKDMDSESLKQKIIKSIQDKDKLIAMGKESYELILSEHSFKKYKDSILAMRDKVEQMMGKS